MKTAALLEIIGEPQGSIIIKDRFGNATLHRKGFWSCDPCYLPSELGNAIKAAYHAKFPWAGYDHKMHHDEWCEFEFQGHTLYARDHEDGDGFFGNCVDAGWIVVFPFDLAPEFMKNQMRVGETVNAKPEASQEEKIIAENHRADVENGLSEADASASDSFERRVMGMDEPEDEEDGQGPEFKNGRCTRCKRTADYCEC